jgi:hypothetical protein
MPNHFHLVVETPNGDLVAGMRWLLASYTIRLNHRHKLAGHVFGGRYKALLVDGSGSGYLKTVCDYAHLNPVRARLLAPEEPLVAYPWTSMGFYLAAPELRPAWLRVDRLLGEHGIREDSFKGRQEFERQLEGRRLAEIPPEELKAIRRGWCLGRTEFRKEMLALLGDKLGPSHAGELHRESAIAKAERIVADELKSRGLKEVDLERLRKGDPAKMEIASRLRRETTLSVKNIAARVGLGTSKSANARLHKWMRAQPLEKPGLESEEK